MKNVRQLLGVATVSMMIVAVAVPRTASAGNDAIWGAVGGLVAGKLLSDHQQKKQAEAYQQGAEDQYVVQQQQAARAQQQSANSPEARLARLKSLKDQGLITESDYNTQKAAIVSSL